MVQERGQVVIQTEEEPKDQYLQEQLRQPKIKGEKEAAEKMY